MADSTTYVASSRRLAALVALLSGAALVILLTTFLFRNIALLITTWMAMVIAVFAVGWALRNPGWRRHLGLAVAIGGVVVGIAAVLAAGASNAGLVAGLIVLGVIVGFSGRHALRTPRLPEEWPLRSRHPVLIVNPKSGDGKAERVGLAAAARRRGIDVVVLERGDDLVEVAQAAVARGADALGMAAGDGSLGPVAGVALEAGIAFVPVPSGTRNHFARDIGLDRDDPLAALDSFWGVERVVDYARVNGRVFLNNVSLGLYASMVASAGYRGAKAETALEVLSELERSGKRFDLAYEAPDGKARGTADLVLVSNNPYTLTGLMGDIGKRPRLDSQQLGVLTLTVDSDAEIAQLVTLYSAGAVERFGGWSQWTTRSFRVDSADAVVLAGIDGESVQLQPPLEFLSCPASLRVAVPMGTPPGVEIGFRGSSRHLSDLWRIAQGRPPR